ncbi:type IV pilus modification PilV family protein [Domibacillus indicus]|uniref:type IV pilus modification PilV family protein n=1 Tax=Domibacillus indicus TaxID=1437523 RepID=UPI0006183484|nr:prepilin-type N-terminal cleavage/methylation domain-containing protein [Domibacillus indicus]
MAKKIKNCQSGVTLIELLVSLTILTIILLSVTRFFFQAATFNASNESRTVALNVARNALMFMEKQSFVEMRHEFENPGTEKWLKMCPSEGDPDIYVYTLEPSNPESNNIDESKCRNIEVNNGSYHAAISLGDIENAEEKKYYIPIKVKVGWTGNGPQKTMELDGTIKSEDLR